MNSNPNNFNPKKALQTLSIIHGAMIAGLVIIGTLFYSLADQLKTDTMNTDDPMIFVFPLLGLAGIFAGTFLYRKLLEPTKSKKSLSEKWGILQTASIVRYAMVEGPALLNIFWFEQTGNLLYLTVGGTLILYFYVLRPTRNLIEKDLGLTSQERRQFD